MIRALVVDDEAWIRLGLREQIDWKALGVAIVGEAANGRDALGMIGTLRPDIVLSDIRMPLMDGIELMETVHKDYPDILIIVISGYSDFEYARKAVTFQVFDYILKPIEEEQLEAVLVRAIDKLEERQRAREDLLRMDRRLRENGALAEERLLTRLAEGAEDQVSSLLAKLDRSGLRLSGACFAAAVFRAANEEQVSAARFGGDRELAGYALFNLIGEHYGDTENKVLFRHGDRREEIVLVAGCDSIEEGEALLETLRVKCGRASADARAFLGMELYVGFGGIADDPKQISRAYKEAAAAVLYAGLESDTRIVFFSSLSGRSRYYVYPEDKEKAFLHYLDNGYRIQALTWIDSVLADIRADRSYHPLSLRMTSLELAMNLRRASLSYPSGGGDLLQESHMHVKLMRELLTYADIVHWLRAETDRTLDRIAAAKKTGSRRTLDDVVDYVDKHYCEDINLNGVAERFYMSPAYLSRIFKQAYNENFNEYVNRLRMDAAAKLLQQADLKLEDISGMVGYGNVSYFLKKFKERYGCTPTAYRKLHARAE
ncbi:response regulator [Cohnella hashimotonis]|uniref:Response regulator n=1 Tax=Cohnella hashimotonis TaxID=2826895 RepID=A0ABT6TIW4_9BACL|nr:response regulator [Cohnella hashimotonis]MDI4646670.1 response regulator [Cohnella hashimotonis]